MMITYFFIFIDDQNPVAKVVARWILFNSNRRTPVFIDENDYICLSTLARNFQGPAAAGHLTRELVINVYDNETFKSDQKDRHRRGLDSCFGLIRRRGVPFRLEGPLDHSSLGPEHDKHLDFLPKGSQCDKTSGQTYRQDRGGFKVLDVDQWRTRCLRGWAQAWTVPERNLLRQG